MTLSLRQRQALVVLTGLAALVGAAGITEAHVFHQPSTLKYAVTIVGPGSVRGFDVGVFAPAGQLESITDVTAADNRSDGFRLNGNGYAVTRCEALANAEEAIRAVLAYRRDHGIAIPADVHPEVRRMTVAA